MGAALNELNNLFTVVSTVLGLWGLGASVAAWRGGHVRRRGGLAYLRLLVLHRRSRVRFSSSALLSLDDEAGDLLVVYTETRDEAYWGPVGGVVKAYRSGVQQLARLEAHPDIHRTPAVDMDADLRLYLPMKNLPRLLAWYEAGSGRESALLALAREMYEELPNAGLSVHTWFDDMRLPLSTVRECRPLIFRDARDPALWHYRLFTVFELEEPARTRLLHAAQASASAGSVSFVRRADISGRRHEGHRLGFHTDALLRDQVIATTVSVS